MDRLIEECEKKFYEHFSEKGEKQLNLQQYASDEGKEGYSLSSLAEMDSHLMRDKHFNEMFQDVKRYCSDSFIRKAKHMDRYYVLIGGLLRQLLRASGSTFDPYERKVLIEKVYSWYREKRKVLLEHRLKSRRRVDTQKNRALTPPVVVGVGLAQPPPTQQKDSYHQKLKRLVMGDRPDAISLDKLDEDIVKPEPPPTKDERLPSLGGTNFDLETPGIHGKHFIPDKMLFSPQSLPAFVNNEKKKQLFISNKLKQYARRNLAETHEKRIENLKPHTSHAQRTAPSNNDTSNRPSTSAVDSLAVRKDSEDKMGFLSQPRFVNYQKAFDFSKTGAYKHWIEHRAREAEEELEEVEFKDTIQTWAFNRARIEEEIYRRQESSRYSSQTGTTVHKIVQSSRMKEESARVRQRLQELEDQGDQFLDSDSDMSEEEQRKEEPKKLSGSDDDEHESIQDEEEEDDENSDEEDDEDSDEDDLQDKENTSPSDEIFLSPYKNLERVTHQYRPSSPVLANESMMDTSEKAAAQKGFIRPMTTGTSTIPRTPIIAFHRELEPTMSDAVVTGEKKPLRPKTVPVFENVHQDSLDNVRHIHYTNPEKVHFHSVLDRDGLVPEPPKKKTKKSKKEKKAPPPPPPKKGKKGKKGKKAAAPPPEPEPEKPPSPRAPSLLRSAQLDECERIKMSLARSGYNVPTSVIERSILIPEDRTYSECVRQLPSSTFLSLECVKQEIKEPGKKKTVKKKKKKGGKKKKKK